MTDDAKTLAERGGMQAMKTCGECVHFEAGQHGRYGYCRCDVPVWALRGIDNVAGTTACSDTDTQANDCDTFCNRQLMGHSISNTRA